MFQFSVFAKFISGESRFFSQDSDSLSFVKEQLLYKSFYEVIKKELNNLGLDAKVFDENYQREFDEYFAGTKEKINQKFGIGERNLDRQQQKSYRDEIRMAKLKALRNFKGIQRTIHSYVIKKMSRSSANPRSRYMSIEAKVNRDELTRLYYSLVSKNLGFGTIQKLYLNINYNLAKTTWDEIGISNSASFKEVINKNWLKWFKKNKSANIEKIELLNLNRKELIDEWMRSDTSLLKNSVMVYLNLNIEKVVIDEKISEYVFRYSGNMHLKDLHANKFIKDVEMADKIKKHFDVKPEDLQNILANYIYRYPLGDFAVINKNLAKIQFKNQQAKIQIAHFDSFTDVWKFAEALESSGISISVDAEISNISKKSATIGVVFHGESSGLDNLLNRLSNNWPDQQLRLNLAREDESYKLELLRSGQDIPTT